MDPNTNISEILAMCNELLCLQSASRKGQTANEELFRLAELIYALDEWLVGGGFLPNRWSNASPAAPKEELITWLEQRVSDWRYTSKSALDNNDAAEFGICSNRMEAYREVLHHIRAAK